MLAGREVLETQWRMMLSDIGGSGRKHARDIILRGPRRTGKTVLLTRFAQLAEAQGYGAISLQMTKGGPGIIAGILAYADLNRQKPAWQRARDALQFLAATNATAAGIPAEDAVRAGIPNSGDPGPLAEALATLARELRADAPGAGLLITLGELQVSQPADLALLAATLQRLDAEHPDSPVAFAASALLTINERAARRWRPARQRPV